MGRPIMSQECVLTVLNKMADLIISLAMPKYPPHHPLGSEMMTEEASRAALKGQNKHLVSHCKRKTE